MEAWFPILIDLAWWIALLFSPPTPNCHTACSWVLGSNVVLNCVLCTILGWATKGQKICKRIAPDRSIQRTLHFHWGKNDRETFHRTFHSEIDSLFPLWHPVLGVNLLYLIVNILCGTEHFSKLWCPSFSTSSPKAIFCIMMLSLQDGWQERAIVWQKCSKQVHHQSCGWVGNAHCFHLPF